MNLQKMADVKSRYLESVGAVKDTTERIDKLQRQLSTVPARRKALIQPSRKGSGGCLRQSGMDGTPGLGSPYKLPGA